MRIGRGESRRRRRLLTPAEAQEALADDAVAQAASDGHVGLPGFRQHPAEGREEEEVQESGHQGAHHLRWEEQKKLCERLLLPPEFPPEQVEREGGRVAVYLVASLSLSHQNEGIGADDGEAEVDEDDGALGADVPGGGRGGGLRMLRGAIFGRKKMSRLRSVFVFFVFVFVLTSTQRHR